MPPTEARRRRWLLPAVAGGLALGGLLLVLWLRWESEPRFEGRPLSAWVNELGSLDPTRRAGAARGVRGLGLRALPPLIRAVARSDSWARKPVLAARAHLPRPWWRQLYRMVRPYEEEYHRRLAAKALGLLGPQAQPAIPALRQALREHPESFSETVCEALGAIGRPAVPTLVEALGGTNNLASGYAALALSRLGPQAAEALPTLVELLGSSGPRGPIAASVMPHLGALAVPPLVGVLAERGENASAAISENLVTVASFSHEALLALLQAANHPSAKARARVAQLLAKVEPPARRSVVVLVGLLEDADAATRAQAATALGALAPRTPAVTNAVAGLTKRLEDPQEAVRAAARQALQQITERPAPAPARP